MKLFTLIAGYAAGLAVAMKYRKDNGTSKLTSKSKKSTVDTIVDEIVDIHKSAYTDARTFMQGNLDDVNDFDTLKSKVTPFIDNFTAEAESLFDEVSEKGAAKKAALQSRLADLVTEKKTLLDAAKSRGEGFSDVAADTIAAWIEGARAKLETAHAAISAKLEKTSAVQKSPAKSPTKKSPAKKPAARKPAVKKSPTA